MSNNKLNDSSVLILHETLKIINSEFKTINSGGCGIFARLLSRELNALGYETQFVFIMMDTHYSQIIDLNKDLKSRKISNVLNYSWAHIMTLSDGKFMDSTGVYKSLGGTRWVNRDVSNPFNIDVLNDMLHPKYSGIWNPRFDRRQSGLISIRLKRHLKDLSL